MNRFIISIFFFIISFQSFAVADPYYIRSAMFHQGNESLIPIFKLGERFQFSFDDLIGDGSDYYYQIVHCTRDWKKSDLKITEYLKGAQSVRIPSYQTSFNTFQAFANYTILFPNRDSQIMISGNFILEIYNVDGEKVLERRFVLYENLAQVSLEVKKTRNLEVAPFKQNIYMNIDFGNELLQNPKQNVNVVILQNGQWYNALTNLKPQYILGNQFKYQYDEETNFWAGNEFLYFDTSDIRQINNNVSKITRSELYEVYLYPTKPLKENKTYSFYQDVNGAFKPRNKFRENPNTEADYTWVYLTYNLEKLPSSQKLYAVGMFNDYQLNNDSEMKFDSESNAYKTALFVKQGFTNYKYVIADNRGKVLEELNPDGNFYETENIYHALVYYKNDSDRYERIIGLGNADSKLITN